MGAILAYLRNPSRCLRSQSSGLSPSPTEETAANRTFGTTDETQNESKLSVSAADEPKPAEEPESNDTSYGVEATAVRTLAASTGTVAILGTTAKALESTESTEPIVLGDPSSIESKDNPSTLGSIVVAKVLESEIPSDEKGNELSEQAIVHESSDAENSVLQQKEIKQIENEALQEKMTSELQASLSLSALSPPPKPSPTKDDENEIEQTEKETLLQGPPFPHEPEKTVIVKDESQLPKIVDVQEKKIVVAPTDAAKPVVDDKPVNVELPKEGVTPTSDNSTEESKEPSIAATELPTPSEDRTKVPPESSPDISKTEEDNEISSEQLKTNSLSDMSLSEALNSEGEEAAREAAKAQELQEMVASLSASAKDTTLDYSIAVAETSISSQSSVGTSARKSMELEPISHEVILEEKYSPETNEDGNILTELDIKIEPTDLKTKESPSETSEPPSNESPSSKSTEESRISDKVEPDVEEQSTKQIEIEDGDKKEQIQADQLGESAREKKKEHEESTSEVAVDNDKATAAATTIQSTFRGYKTRKALRAQNGETPSSLSETDIKNASNETISPDKEERTASLTSEVLPEKTGDESLEMSQLEKKDEENQEDICDVEPLREHSDTGGSLIANAPESLVKIAQAEVDKICVEAEKATESLMTPPPTIDTDNIDNEYQDDNEEFPAPPDDLLDMMDKNDIAKEEQDSSGTEPTIPLGETEGDSSKTEDTTAPSIAESEIKSQDPAHSQKLDATKLESSLTDNINTEVAVNRDSTEGELTMEEDSKEEDIGSILLTTKEQESDKTDSSKMQVGSDEEKAATVIQAGYRGFKTRQDLKKGAEKLSIITPETEEHTSDLYKKTPSKDKLTLEHSEQEEVSITVKSEEKTGDLTKTPEKIDNIPDPANQELISAEAEKKPKRPDQIDVLPRSEDISLIHGEDLSAPLDSDSKDDTSSTSLSEEELNEKASKIQAGIRGYLVRKEQKAKRDAAVKIQSTFRGFKTRQRLKQEEPVNVEVTKTS